MKRHCLGHFTPVGFPCSFCKATFRRKDNLRTHMLRHVHRNGKGNESENRRSNGSLDSGTSSKDMECEKEESTKQKPVSETVTTVESVVHRSPENEKINVPIKHEIEEIEDFVMISAKEAKDLLYTLFSENFITTTEISKTPDHAPSRTFFLFTVNIQHVASMVLNRCYKALYNAMVKKETEVNEHRRLLDKQERMEAIAASVEDASQRDEILNTITPSEQEQIIKVRRTIQMLDHSELQICEGIFILEMYLMYFKQRQKDKS
uniref:DNA-directed RNA polymerase III subunit RPC3 n=1 Tax=Magallana gigas TaxID=29159 RepID=K1PJ04_MAGGI